MNWTAFISVIFSSSSFIIFGNFIPPVYTLEKEIIFALLVFSVTILNSIVLAFGVSHKMVLHRDLKKSGLNFMGVQVTHTECEDKIENLEHWFYDLNTLEPPANRKQLELAHKRTCLKMNLVSPKK